MRHRVGPRFETDGGRATECVGTETGIDGIQQENRQTVVGYVVPRIGPCSKSAFYVGNRWHNFIVRYMQHVPCFDQERVGGAQEEMREKRRNVKES